MRADRDITGPRTRSKCVPASCRMNVHGGSVRSGLDLREKPYPCGANAFDALLPKGAARDYAFDMAQA